MRRNGRVPSEPSRLTNLGPSALTLVIANPKLAAGVATQAATVAVSNGTTNSVNCGDGVNVAMAPVPRDGGAAPAIDHATPFARWLNVAWVSDHASVSGNAWTSAPGSKSVKMCSATFDTVVP